MHFKNFIKYHKLKIQTNIFKLFTLGFLLCVALKVFCRSAKVDVNSFLTEHF